MAPLHSLCFHVILHKAWFVAVVKTLLSLGREKNVNLPGVIVDLPTLTEKDKEDILKWGVPNKIDMIALSFVRKGSDLQLVRSVLGEHAKSILLMSKVCSPL